MRGKKSIKLKRHETFSIREGWLEKAINIFNVNENCFSKDNGQQILGIGTNMVKSLRYWTEACGLIGYNQGKGYYYNELGAFLLKYDRYLSEMNSWWLIHLHLVTNFDSAPVFNTFFNMELNKFDKEQLFNQIKAKLEYDYELGVDSSLEADCNMLIKSYYSDDISNPENNMTCPLSKLGLIGTNDKRVYYKLSPKYSSLDYRVVYYAMVKSWNENSLSAVNSFNLEDMYQWKNNPINVFNLSKSSMYQYLDEMKKKGLINLIKTAGLNTISIDRKLSLNELFRRS